MKVSSSLVQTKKQELQPKQFVQKQIVSKGLSTENVKECQEIAEKAKQNISKKISIIKRIYSCISFPITLLLWYFIFEMLLFASIELISDIYSSFAHFFSRMKAIFQQNSLFLLFWAVIIIKTKIPQMQRLFYHTIVRSILQNQQTQCSICLNQQCDYIMPKCHHQYHALCLQKWLRSQACCPYCRTKTEKQIVRKIPWKLFLQSITQNKIKWLLIILVCLFVQFRFSENSFIFLNSKHKIDTPN